MSWVDGLAIRDGLLAENRRLDAENARLKAVVEGLEARLRWSEAMREGRFRG